VICSKSFISYINASSNDNVSIFDSILKTVLQKRDHPHHRVIDKECSHFLLLSFALTFRKGHRRLQSNGAERNVEFVLAPQHETSYDPETTTKEDFDYLK